MSTTNVVYEGYPFAGWSGQPQDDMNRKMLGQEMYKMAKGEEDSLEFFNACIHHLVESQVLQQPDAPAICAWDGNLSYAELNRLSTQLANHLVNLGVGTETLVPFCFEKSTWAVVTMFAILKAGAACVALNPEHPVNRLVGLVEQTSSSIVLAGRGQADIANAIGVHLPLKLVVVDGSFVENLKETNSTPSAVMPYHPAFVVFTSGSTGQPKGVILEHRSLCTSARAHATVLNIDNTSRVFQFSAYSFDASIQENFTTLMRGGCICIPSEMDRMNHLAASIERLGANWIFLTPTVARLLQPAAVPCLRTVNIGGEFLGNQEIDAWSESVDLFECYGPTECSIYCAWRGPIKSSKEGKGRCWPLSCAMFIVDQLDHNILMPDGSIGEILVEGPLLARGYLNDHEKTARSFIYEPEWAVGPSGVPGKRRFYKTGDLGYQSLDGTFTLIGRKDGQVKINGQRVELTEIETQIRLHFDEIEHAVVDLFPLAGRIDGVRSLMGYISFKNSSKTSAHDPWEPETSIVWSSDTKDRLIKIQHKLNEILPVYMVPKTIVTLARMPLTTSGKLDRVSLRQLSSQLSEDQARRYSLSDQVRQPPSSKMERDLQALWAMVLKLRDLSIGIDDNFLQLGGDSIRAMQLISIARDKGIVLTVADIFRTSKLSDLALVAKYSTTILEPVPLPFTLIDDVGSVDHLKREAAAQCAIKSEDIEDIYPTTPLQEGLMTISLQHSGAYMLQKVFSLPEKVDVQRFCQAWNVVVAAHPILRTRIIQTDQSTSLQVVIKDKHCQIHWQTPTSLEAYLTADWQLPVSSGGPLTRYAIVDSLDGRRHFVWTAHHSIYDGWSLPLILDAVADFYVNTTFMESPSFSIFSGFVSSPTKESIVSFWREKLSGFCGRPFPSSSSSFYRPRVNATVAKVFEISLKTTSNITVPSLIRAAWTLVLSEHTNSNDVTFGMTLTGRNAALPGIEKTIGPTITTVPVRVRIDKDQTISAFLSSIQNDAIDMIPYEQAGLQNIRRFGGSDCQQACSFQNLLVVQPGFDKASDNRRLVGLDQTTTNTRGFHAYAMVVECTPDEGNINVEVQYDSGVIQELQVQTIVDHFQHCLLQLFNHAKEDTINDIDLCTPRDMEMIKAWNNDSLEAVKACVHDLIEQQSIYRPNAPAICAWDHEFTYTELDDLSSRLAYYLVGLGVGPETLVPFCFEKSAWAVVTMLAILRAGGACVALNPTDPMSRLIQIIKQTETSILLVGRMQNSIVENLLKELPIQSVVVDYDFVRSLTYISEPIYNGVTQNHPAFVVFTSGSTGQPKGVVLEHRAICTSARAHGTALGIDHMSRVFQFAAYTFDISIQDNFTTLIRGGCICIPSETDRMSNLTGVIQQLKANWAFLTPTVARLIEPGMICSTLKTLVLAGEPVTKEDINTWAGALDLHICYGPAECSIHCTWTGKVSVSTESGVVGRFPLASSIWIVDAIENRRLVPVGCVGEILVEGPLLARGYLGDKEKTDRSFVEDPVWAMNHSSQRRRFYRTGDLGRFEPDGTIRFVARKDTQVKIHGQRVELGEIESHIRVQDPSIEYVVVDLFSFARQTREDRKLVAFISYKPKTSAGEALENNSTLLWHEEITIQLAAIERSLQDALPGYMIPKVFLPLRRMPLTISGKLDRVRLRQISSNLTMEEVSKYLGLQQIKKQPPVTKMEHDLNTLWATTLKISPSAIGRDDDFFRIGGDSVRAMRLISAARKQGIALTVAQVFRYPKLSDLATVSQYSITTIESTPIPFSLIEETDGARIDIIHSEAAKICAVPVESVEDIYPCTPLQEGLMSLSVQQPGAYLMQKVFEIPETVDIQRFRSAWETVVAAHAILRTRIIQTEDSRTFQVLVKESISWQTSSSSLSTYLEEDWKKVVSFGTPLARYAIISHDKKQHFVWTAHHSIYDGWSISLLLDSFSRCYQGKVMETSPTFASFTKLVGHAVDKASSEYWTSQLDGTVRHHFPQLPRETYQPRTTAQLCHRAEISPAESALTLPTIIRASWAMVIAQHTSSDDVNFGMTLSGRNSGQLMEIENLVGPTITTVPVRIHVDRTQRVSEYLQGVQNQAIDMIPFEHTGLQNIKRINLACQEGCSFQNLLVVHPEDEVEPENTEDTVLNNEKSNMHALGFHTYALVIECKPQASHYVDIEVHYDPEVIEDAYVELLISQLVFTIQQLTSFNPEARVSELNLCSTKDMELMLGWNSGTLEEVNALVHEIVEGQVLQLPNDAPAICAWDLQLSYKELNNLSSRLAHYLANTGIGPDSLVPFCFEKSGWTVVTMFAVLKAGGACVPLNPDNPPARLAGLVRQTGSSVLVTSALQAPLGGIVAAQAQAQVIVVNDDLISRLNHFSGLSEPINLTPQSPAFVVFTSGSTGEPKGIILEHRTICTGLQAHSRALGIERHSRVFQFSAYTFDVSIQDHFTTLMCGGCICIPSDADRVSDLAGAMRRLDANWCFLTPTVARLLQPSAVPNLKTLVLAGEPLGQQDIDTWAHALNLHVCYGPAECTIHCTHTGQLSSSSDAKVVGYGLNSFIWVVDRDDHNRLLPVGAVGELLVEGPLLARGYLGDEEKTAQSFIEEPRWAREHTDGLSNRTADHIGTKRRFYKTGDLGRFKSNGSIRFVGRKDTQVKVNGQRVEVSEIEAHMTLESMQHSIVLLPKSGPCQQRLTAVITFWNLTTDAEALSSELHCLQGAQRESASAHLSALRERLTERLPPYMIPVLWVVAGSALPLGPTGKLDRKRITKWIEDMDEQTYHSVIESAEEEQANDHPATPTERKLQRICAHVLNLPVSRVGLNRSFISLGGDSISAMQLVSRCRSESLTFSTRDVLSSRCLAQLALRARVVGPSTVDLEENFGAEHDLSPIQQFHFESASQGPNNHFNQSFLLRLRRRVRTQDLARALEAVVSQHSMLRARFRRSDGKWTQTITSDIAQSMLFRIHDTENIDSIAPIIRTSHESIDIINGPIFIADYFDVENGQEQLLSLIVHHLVVDLVSWRIVLEDLEELLGTGTLSNANRKSLPFLSWSHLQAEYARDRLPPEKVLPAEVFQNSLMEPGDDYWGMSNSRNLTRDMIEESFTLDESLTNALLGPKANSSLHTQPVEVFHAAILHAFLRIFNDRKAPTIFNEGHGREPWNPNIDILRTVGWFTTLWPVHVSYDDDSGDDLVELLRRTKDARRKVPGNGWPYFTSRYLNPQGVEMFGKQPIEILLNYLGQYQQLERDDALFKRWPGGLEGMAISDIGQDVSRLAYFEISVSVEQNQLEFSFTWSQKISHQREIRRWISECQHSITTAVSQLTERSPEPTLSDFPLIPMTYTDLEQLETEIFPRFDISGFDKVDKIYPCSPIQEAMLIGLAKDSANYAVCLAWEINSNGLEAPDPNRVCQAWEILSSQYEALRTIFVDGIGESGAFAQVVLREAAGTLLRVNDCEDSEIMGAVSRHDQVIKAETFGQTHQMTVYQTSTGRVYCKLQINHALIDGTSIAVLMHNFALAYDNQLSTVDSDFQYDHYITYVRDQPFEPSINYWRSFLTNIEPCFFPIEDLGVMKADRRLHTLQLDLNVASQLRTFCQVHEVTVANVLMVSWALVLRCFMGSDDICFGSLTSGRDIPVVGIENAIGAFINMFVSRLELTATTPMLEILKQSQEQYLHGLEHQHCTLADIQHALELSGQALFNTTVNIQNQESINVIKSTKEASIRFNELPGNDPSEYAISLTIDLSDLDHGVYIRYWTDQVSDERVKNIASIFETALQNASTWDRVCVGEVDLLGERDLKQILDWNGNSYEAQEQCIHFIIEDQARQQPNAPAVYGWDGNFSYTDLNELSTKLSRYLSSLGVKRGTLVPFCFEKSSWTVIAMLATLKAGGACVALNPDHPPDRLAGVIQQTEATIVLAGRRQVDIMQELSLPTPATVVPVDAHLFEGLSPDVGDLHEAASPSDPAFVVFTSGSTGQPKGVVLEHRAIFTGSNAHGSAMGVCQSSRVLQFADYTFDVSIQDIFTTLTKGGCVCVLSEAQRMNHLATAINDMEVNWTFLTPTVANLLTPEEVPCLKTLVLGGEAISKANVQRWSQAVTLINSYGPAECSVCSSVRQLTSPNSMPNNFGRSGWAWLWITEINNHDKLAPIGCIGELLIEGPTLARGYLNDESKTAGSFIKDPLWSCKETSRVMQHGRRFYKTGDLVRYHPDGTMEFIGRKDNQVKIRGQRIEIGEIEHHLRSSLPEQWSSSVELTKIPGRERRQELVAFLSSQNDETRDSVVKTLPLADDLRKMLYQTEARLSQFLTDAMIPSLYIVLDRLPMTWSKKVDRKLLRQLAMGLSEDQVRMYSLSGEGKQAPTNTMELALRTLWAIVLGISEVSIGRDDSFFRLGGDSVQAMRLVSAARAKGIIISVTKVFRYPKLLELAGVADFSSGVSELQLPPFSLIGNTVPFELLRSQAADQCSLPTDHIQDMYPCTSLQEGLMALSVQHPGAYVLQKIMPLTNTVDDERFRGAWSTMVESNDILRTRIIQIEESRSLQVVVHTQIQWHTGQNLSTYLETDGRLLPSYGAPLMRFALLNENGTKYFVWTIHHAIYDGWSMSLMLSNFKKCYDGEPLRSSPPFVNFVKSIMDTHASASNYWQTYLTGTSSLAYPRVSQVTSQPRATAQFHHQAKISLRKSTLTLSNVIRASWALVIGEHTRSNDVTFGMTLAGRNGDLAGIEHLVGPAMTTVPVRVRIDRNENAVVYLTRIHDQAIEMIPYEHTGLQNIQKIGPDCRQACQFQNLIVVHPTVTGESETSYLFDLDHDSIQSNGFHTYALVVEFTPDANSGLKIDVQYDGTAISKLEVQGIIAQFEHVTRQLVECSEALTVNEINMCSPRDIDMMLDFNSNSNIEAINVCVHQMVEDQAHQQPIAPAICSWDGEFSYAELDAITTRLAHHLVTQYAVRPGSIVPFCFDKSAWAVVAMLATLKAGGACVALNPDHPTSRLLELISQTNAKTVLTGQRQSETVKAIARHTPISIITVDSGLLYALPEDISATAGIVTTPADAAFIVFTSGSTGRPKGVILEHQSISTSAFAHGTRLGIDNTSRVFQFSAYTFDASIMDNFTTLMRGGCICIPSDTERMNNISGAISQLRANWVFLTPTVARLIHHPSAVPTLKTMVLGGEPMSPNEIATWAGALHLYDGYGPSECSIFCAFRGPIRPTTDVTNLWRPLASKIWIADPMNHDRLVPIGVAGELMVEGPLLAREYIGDPEKTAELFIENPLWASQQEQTIGNRRFYKTGDLGRLDPNGALQLVGRKDDQVKVHGQRVELGEIEFYLGHEALKHSMVLFPTSGPCHHRLVAMVSFKDQDQSARETDLDQTTTEIECLQGIAQESSLVTIADIRRRLMEMLPPYMVPAVWIAVSSLPLASAGKLDRQYVSQWIKNMDENTYRLIVGAIDERDLPATTMERKLQQIWAWTLNLPVNQIGLSRSFISHGGDSISAMQALSKCRSEGIIVSVKDIISAKTIPQLALRARMSTKMVSHQAEAIGIPSELSPIQQLYFQLMPQGENHYNQSFILRLKRRVGIQELSRALEAVVSQHSMLRARFTRQSNGYWTQTVTAEIATSLRFRVHKSRDPNKMSLGIRNSQESLNITNGPVVSADLFSAEGQNHDADGQDSILALVAHHLVVDLVSWRIILEDLEELLQTTTLSSPKPMAFTSWCKLQAEYAHSQLPPEKALPVSLSSGSLSRQAAFSHQFNVDNDFWGMASSQNCVSDVLQESFILDEKTTKLLLGSANNFLRTQPIELFHAALLHAFLRVFPTRQAPTIFHEGHGREPWDDSVDILRTVGWFTTLWPVHIATDTNYDMIELLKRIKDARRKIPGNGWPYFASRFLNPQGKEAFGGNSLPMEIVLNYLGQYQQLERQNALFEHWNDSLEEVSDLGQNVRRMALFDVIVSIEHGITSFTVTWNRQMNHQPRIRDWITESQQSLIYLITQLTDRAAAKNGAEYTLSDFPLLDTTYGGLERLRMETLPKLGLAGFEDIETIYPCTNMQQAMWIGFAKDPHYYEVRLGWHITVSAGSEPVDVKRIYVAWEALVGRHEALRTIFVESTARAGLFDQIVLKVAAGTVSLLDCDDDDPRTILQHQEPMQHGIFRPTHHFTIYRTASGQIYCGLQIHHALIDGTSLPVLVRDFGLAYDGKLEPESDFHYSNYVTYVQDQAHTGLNYWKTFLEGAEPCHFPIDSINTNKVAKQHTICIDLNLGPSMLKFREDHGTTMANIVLVCWALVLRCFVGSDSVCFGILTSGRDAPIKGIDDAFGAIINMLVGRIELKSDRPLMDVLLCNQSDYLQSLDYQYCSLADIQHELGLSNQALFNTAISIQNQGPVTDEKGSIQLNDISGYDPSEYAITLNANLSDLDPVVYIRYWTDMISDERASAIGRVFTRILSSVPEWNKLRVEDVDLLSESDEKQIQNWNSAINMDTMNACIHHVIEERIDEQPNAPAICAWDRNFSYAQLQEFSDRLAQHLVSLGVGPETFVPFCFEKSAFTVVAILAILKAGGACVVLHPDHPAQHLATLVDQAGSNIVLAGQRQHHIVSAISNHTPISIITVDDELLESYPKASSIVYKKVLPHHPAYVIFTSGSTGTPKGVILEHAALCTSARAHGSLFGITSKSRVFQFAAYTFDISIMDNLTTLMRGGCICIPSETERTSNLAQAICQYQANWVFLTPTVARLIHPSEVPCLRTVVLGGESVGQSEMVASWAKSVTLFDGYGPSECSVICAGGPIGQTPTSRLRPISCAIWIVDVANHDKLVPIGCIGELLVEGPLLSRGYLKDPEKTAKSFIENPAWTQRSSVFTHTGGRRFYKTGDLGYYNTDGTISLAGRKDSQVKIHGQRVELGHIESQIELCSSKIEHVAAGLYPLSGYNILAAFISYKAESNMATKPENLPESEIATRSSDVQLLWTQDTPAQLEAIEHKLSQNLPSYMIPNIIIPLTRMPLLTSGKLDRTTLKKLAPALSEAQKSMTVNGKIKQDPTTNMEKNLQSLWANVLQIEKSSIGRTDSFFRLGGDSIGAMRLITAARKDGILLTVSQIFRSPLLWELAAVCRHLSDGPVLAPAYVPFSLLEDDHLGENSHLDMLCKEAAGQCGIDPGDIEDIYPCTPLQEGLMALSVTQPGSYMLQKVFDLGTTINLPLFCQAWEAVVEAQAILRTRIIQTAESKSLQVVVKEKIEWNRSDSVATYLEAQNPIGYGTSLTSYAIILGQNGTKKFVWTAHHAVYDGWLISLVLDAVTRFYESKVVMPLTPYHDFIRGLKAVDVEGQNNFWRSYLKGVESSHFPKPPSSTYKSTCDSSLVESKKFVSRSQSSYTLPLLIQASWAIAVSRYARTKDIVFGMTLNGRRADINNISTIAGPTLTTIPVRVQLDGRQNIPDLLRSIKEQSIEMIPYEQTGLQYIRRLGPDCNNACNFNTLLVIQTDHDSKSSLFIETNQTGDALNFSTYPLTVEFGMENDILTIDSQYDQAMISEKHLRHLFSMFHRVLQQVVGLVP